MKKMLKNAQSIALLILIIAAGGCSSSGVATEEPKFTVSGKMVHFPPQCSGTLTENYWISTTAQPLPNTVFYIKRGEYNTITDTAVASFKTDENGFFSVKLPAGTYCLLHQFQKDTMSINAVRQQEEYYEVEDEGTIWQSFKNPIALITVKDKNIDSLEYRINVQCFLPAGMAGFRYIGPMPE